MIKCIKRRTWIIIIVLVVAMLLIAAVLASENEPEPDRTFGGTFIKGYFYEHLYQAQEKNQFI